nr:hypothetical protein [Tanacetum cinerariifolium]
MTAFLMISRQVYGNYHNKEHDEMAKRILNSEKNKAGVGMTIPNWMITDEMKLTEIYRMYAEAFGVDVPTNQSQPIESTKRPHRTTSKSLDELEAKQNVEKVKENLITEEIDKLVKGTKNVENSEGFNCFLNNQEVPSTRLEPMSNKESPEVGKTDVVSQRVSVIEEEEESPEDNYELRRREKYQDDPHDDAHLEGENCAKRHKTFEHGTYVIGESLSGQDNKGEPGPQKIVLSLHKFPEVVFPDDDIKERTSKWVDKCVMKFNPYARYKLITTRENGSIVSITESDYKNSKKEKRVMRHQEIHKFYDVTLKRVLEGLKRYNNNVKHGYVTPSLNKGDVEYLQLFMEEIEERLKHHD